jgi:hypothetical protein
MERGALIEWLEKVGKENIKDNDIHIEQFLKWYKLYPQVMLDEVAKLPKYELINIIIKIEKKFDENSEQIKERFRFLVDELKKSYQHRISCLELGIEDLNKLLVRSHSHNRILRERISQLVRDKKCG